MHKSNFWLTLPWSVLKIEKNFVYNSCFKNNTLPDSVEKNLGCHLKKSKLYCACAYRES